LGCGIAYFQYAAMNSITNEIVKEANEIIDKSENKLIENETNPSKQNNLSENKDAALVLEYMQNSKKM
tara:strand:+ start:119 stop:322 length:204 start_codon:yes stop_codon:yes gene_type:complete